MLCLFEAVFESDSEFAGLKSEISNLKSLAESAARQLRGWAESLQESPIPGQRYLTEKVRKSEKARTEREQFIRKLDQIRQGQAESKKA
jgi:hypothetical protein